MNAAISSRRSLRAVTANLACGGPHTAQTIAGAHTWVAAAIAEGVDLLFLQECPSALPELTAGGFDVFAYTGPKGGYRCRSLVAVRRQDGVLASAFRPPSADYHRSYVAGATVTIGTIAFVALSVHASPTPYDDRYGVDWEGEPPDPRAAGGGQLWDSDFVLSTLGRIVLAGHAVLAAGDFNEARSLDKPEARWGDQYFALADGVGLRDSTHRLWDGEVATFGRHQDDRLLATDMLDSRIHFAQVVRRGPLARTASDHRPIEWSIEW